MQIDQLIIKRFQELEVKAQAICETREFDFQSDDGKQYFTIPYAAFAGWGTNVLNLLQRAFGEESVHFKNFQEWYKNFGKWESEFEICRSIFLSAKEDYEGGYLFNLRSLVKAEVLDDAFEQAKELLASGYKDPACILAGVSLEVALKDLCSRNGIATAKLDKMNSDLAKAGILEKYSVELIGASINAIEIAENRTIFQETIKKIFTYQISFWLCLHQSHIVSTGNTSQYLKERRAISSNHYIIFSTKAPS